MDCVYLTRDQIEALYKLTFKQGRNPLGKPAIGVQIRGDADATHPVIFDSVLDKVDDLACAVVEANGAHDGWTI